MSALLLNRVSFLTPQTVKPSTSAWLYLAKPLSYAAIARGLDLQPDALETDRIDCKLDAGGTVVVSDLDVI